MYSVHASVSYINISEFKGLTCYTCNSCAVDQDIISGKSGPALAGMENWLVV